MDSEFEYKNIDKEQTEDIHNMNYEYNINYTTRPPRDKKPVSLGEWIVTMIIGAIPLVGLIVYIVWSFSSTINVSKRNYCRATLILMIAGVVLWILFFMVFGISFMTTQGGWAI